MSTLKARVKGSCKRFCSFCLSSKMEAKIFAGSSAVKLEAAIEAGSGIKADSGIEAGATTDCF